MRRLVNLPDPCAETASCAALVESAAADVIYGAEGLPGFPGVPGTAGANGRDAFTLTASAFVMPSTGALAAAQVIDNRSFAAGQLVYIASVGYFTLDSLIGSTQLNLRNLGASSSLPAGALIGAGLRVTSGGQPGWDTPGNTPKRYAILAHMEDMGEDGGPMQSQIGTGTTAQGAGVVPHLEVISDPDNIASISGAFNSQIRLPVGSWKIRVRAPSFYSKAFQLYLWQRTGDPNIVNTISGGILLVIGNGFAGQTIEQQSHAWADTLVFSTGDGTWWELTLRQASWNFSRPNPKKDQAFGVASNFDNGSGVDVREIYTVIEIEEL